MTTHHLAPAHGGTPSIARRPLVAGRTHTLAEEN